MYFLFTGLVTFGGILRHVNLFLHNYFISPPLFPAPDKWLLSAVKPISTKELTVEVSASFSRGVHVMKSG